MKRPSPSERGVRERAYRAVVFDMDGVLVDTEPAFFAAANDLLAEERAAIDWPRYQRLLGTSVEHTWRELIAMLALRGDLPDYMRRYEAPLLRRLREPRKPLPGVVELLDALARQHIPIAVATSSLRSWYDVIMQSCGLAGRFTTAVTADAIEHAKPAPDTYLRAAELLRVPPVRCIAIEDTPPGIASAKAAGMYTVHVRASSTALPPIEQADLVLETLADFPLSLVA